MKKAKPLTRNIGFKTRSANVDQIQAFPIGLLFMSKNNVPYTCTASVIHTENGNIEVTAAHCLYDHDTRTYFDNIVFYPGYDDGPRPGPFYQIPAAHLVVTDQFLNNNSDEFDWGIIRFDFDINGSPLEYFTGGLDDLENCPNDGVTLCTWEGETILANDYYSIPDLDLGEGSSGAPFMANYDPNSNLGLLYSNFASFDDDNEESRPIYDPIEFHVLIGRLTL
ncbi:hypothetical protein Glove_219g145 [Diversispora epigaea]|uniref:Peptidase S1 domain-containing protein n=1 Tax=Diversispora epigaea TaxID=1348612 RepID=A0A397INX0_9GLOM|nr:hypothetical protein Glove_219g145 [Diversispora epigaea]